MRTEFVVVRKQLWRTASLIILAGTLAGWSATGFAESNAWSGQSLEGAWNVKIASDTPGIDGCAAPAVITRDGGIVAAGCSLAVSPGYGQWVRTGNHRFALTFVGQGFDLATGAINSTYKVRARVRLRQDLQQFSGPFVTDIFALDGSLILTATGTVTADRVTVEPLP
jgi:hypothetical protein